jgi:hypothetical protein
MEQNITKLKNKIAIFLDSRIYGIHDLKEKDLLELVISVDADARKESPKPHISQLANSEEDCREVAKLLNWDEDCFEVKWIVETVRPMISFINESVSEVFNILESGEIGFYDPEDFLGRFQPIPNCLQIAQFILSKYSL